MMKPSNKLCEFLSETINGHYSWSLYFINIDRRRTNPYRAHRIKFENDNYIVSYVNELTKMVLDKQLSNINEIDSYSGDNPMDSCFYMNTEDELIKDNYSLLVDAVGRAKPERFKGKYQAYLIDGNPTNREGWPMYYIKFANPIVEFKNKSRALFNFNSNECLSEITDDVCRLYMNTDIIGVNGNIISFNLNVEKFFILERTIDRIRDNAISEIIGTRAIANADGFERSARSYSNPRLFLSLNHDRLARIENRDTRREVAESLNINLNDDGRFIFDESKGQETLLMQYLCFRIIEDAETSDLLRVNNARKLES